MDTMLTDWTYWLCSIPLRELSVVLTALLIFDAPRYLIGGYCCWLIDCLTDLWQLVRGTRSEPRFDFCPTVCVVVAGLNEGPSLEGSLQVLWGSYPRMEVLVVDDGSSDNMSEVAQRFARAHPGVRVLTRPRRGGKSSAMNAALPLTTAEVIVILDADSELAPNAIWEIVQPLRNPKVGGVSGNVLVRNRHANLLTQIQALEYLRSILVGRTLMSRLGMLGIVSGAFGAFRRSTLVQAGGWDVGPGEDEDLVLRLRKQGYVIEFAPYAECYTDAPTSWKVLVKQRRRWEWAIVTFACRKHIDLANPLSSHFRWGNLLILVDRLIFSLILPLYFWVFMLWLLTIAPHQPPAQCYVVMYLAYVGMEYLQLLLVLYYSTHKWRDLQLAWLPPLFPFYQFIQRLVTTVAIVEEVFTRRSFRDTFVPPHVRKVTWQW